MDNQAPYEQLMRYIASLSAEERETYKDLIEEALQRDRLLTENFQQGKKNAEKFAESMKNMMETALGMHASISQIYEKLSEVRDASHIASRISLNNGPCLN